MRVFIILVCLGIVGAFLIECDNPDIILIIDDKTYNFCVSDNLFHESKYVKIIANRSYEEIANRLFLDTPTIVKHLCWK